MELYYSSLCKLIHHRLLPFFYYFIAVTLTKNGTPCGTRTTHVLELAVRVGWARCQAFSLPQEKWDEPTGPVRLLQDTWACHPGFGNQAFRPDNFGLSPSRGTVR